MQLALRALSEALADKSSKWGELLDRLNITSVFPVRDLCTGQTKQLIFENGTKTMDAKCIVYIFDDIHDCNEKNCNNMCTNLFCEFNEVFYCNLFFGGNSAHYGSVRISLDEKFLVEDVANMSMMAYSDLITDLTFFDDEVLVCQYFQFTTDVSKLFSTVFKVVGTKKILKYFWVSADVYLLRCAT